MIEVINLSDYFFRESQDMAVRVEAVSRAMSPVTICHRADLDGSGIQGTSVINGGTTYKEIDFATRIPRAVEGDCVLSPKSRAALVSGISPKTTVSPNLNSVIPGTHSVGGIPSAVA